MNPSMNQNPAPTPDEESTREISGSDDYRDTIHSESESRAGPLLLHMSEVFHEDPRREVLDKVLRECLTGHERTDDILKLYAEELDLRAQAQGLY